ncbi:MAG: three-Cys-motif partner protein TcmP [Dehalococcoidia bacterium]|nr:three-Cys-motif partner protein TcmP [Dehalococcoidia bacterium]
MAPRTTVWPLEDHTLGKHLVLRNYMDAWLPIVLKTYDRALFVDGFAGPGEYKNGEVGSPIIAMDALAEHAHHNLMKGLMDYIFIEEHAGRFAHLQNVIDGRNGSLPDFCNVQPYNGSYHDVFPRLLDVLESESAVPTFVMIDPFGVSGVFMEQIETLMKYPSTEVYVSFMYDFISRFASRPEFTEHLDRLFGCHDWRRGEYIADPVKRRAFFHGLYERQLRKAGAEYVLPFELYSGNRHVYTVFFATQNGQGCDKMKQAMWKVAPFGDFRFRGGMDRQFTLGSEVVDLSPLREDLVREFRLNAYVGIEEIERFMRTDRTLFHTGQYKSVLANMEREGKVEAKEGTRRQKNRYPPGTVIRFVEPPPPPPTKAVQTAFSL